MEQTSIDKKTMEQSQKLTGIKQINPVNHAVTLAATTKLKTRLKTARLND